MERIPRVKRDLIVLRKEGIRDRLNLRPNKYRQKWYDHFEKMGDGQPNK